MIPRIKGTVFAPDLLKMFYEGVKPEEVDIKTGAKLRIQHGGADLDMEKFDKMLDEWGLVFVCVEVVHIKPILDDDAFARGVAE